MAYAFGDAVLDTDAFELRVGGERVPVEPQVFEVLTHLVEHRNRLVPRTELLDSVWGDRFVSDSALASRVAAARAAIGDDGRAQRFIRTVHGRGFQFVASVAESTSPPMVPLVAEQPELEQAVRFCETADGTCLAVATVGDGRPLVKAATWMTHVEHDWRSPVWRHWMTELGRRFRYIRYDARGGGLSDHDLGGARLDRLETWTGDLEAVVDTLGVDRFVLLGVSQGGPPAMDFAVRHPDRVSHLVLYGTYARGMHQRGAAAAEYADVLVGMIRTGWGGTNPAFRSAFTSTFMPDATSEQMRWFNELQGLTTEPDNAVLLESAFHDHDFSALARRVEVPTMVVHGRDDLAVPWEEGRRLAALVPGTEFVTLASGNHILTADEPAWPDFLSHLDRFTST